MIDQLPKPRRGTTCNGCGVCCRAQRCALSVEFIGEGPGPCPALEYEEGRTWCGLLRNPLKWISSPPEGWPSEDWKRRGIAAEIQRVFAFSLAIGAGCDSDDPKPES